MTSRKGKGAARKPRGRPAKYPFVKMAVGDVEIVHGANAAAAAKRLGRRTGKEFVQTKLSGDGPNAVYEIIRTK